MLRLTWGNGKEPGKKRKMIFQRFSESCASAEGRLRKGNEDIVLFLSSSFLLSAEKKYWLVGECLKYLFRCKVQENQQSIPGNI